MADAPFRRLLGGVVLVCSLAAPDASLMAQDPAAAPAAPPAEQPAAPADPAAAEPAEAEADEAAMVLETITVTAQKREEDVQEVPAAISTLDSAKLDLLTAGGQDIKFLSGRVPSLTMESSFGRSFPRFYIRGLGNTDFDLNASQPVSMIVDEVVLENPIIKGVPIWDIERVEVLRGPQGTLFGRNTPAGVVKFETRKPAQDFDGFVSGSYGSFDNMDVKAAVGGGISDTVSGRISVLYQSKGDWVDNTFDGSELGGDETAGWRGQLLWEPNDRFNALFNVHGWELDGSSRIFRANIIERGSNDVVDGFDQDEVAQDGENFQDISAMGASLKFDYDFDFATLTSVTGWETTDMFSRGDIDGGFGAGAGGGPGLILFPAESADGIPDLDQYTQELRLATNTGGRWDWLAGFFLFDESLQVDSFSYATLAGGIQEGYAFQTQDSTSWALFSSVDFRPSDKWSFKGGLRYTTDEKDFTAERPDPTFQSPTSGPIEVSTEADLVTWDLSSTYAVSDAVNVYGRVGTGFRAPSIQGRIMFCPDFEGGTNFATNCVTVADEEEILSGEIGFKSELMEHRLRTNLAVYTYTVDGQQLVAVGGQTNTARLLNADTTDGYGVEADIDFLPADHWLITLGFSYNHTEIDDPGLSVAVCAQCTVTDPLVGGNALIDGNPLPNAPEIIFNGIVDYRRPAGSGVFSASLDWAYQSEKNFFLYESKEFNGDSFELGFRSGYIFPSGFELAAFARNLTDEVVIQGGIDFNNLTGMTNDPRAYGLELGYHF